MKNGTHIHHRRQFSTALQAAIVIAVALAAHFSFYLATSPFVWLDSVRYAVLADALPHRLATLEWDYHTPPGYPFFLWAWSHWIGTINGLALIQHALAMSTCFLVWWTVYRTCGGRAAMIGGLAVALSPVRHYYAQAILREVLAEWLLVSSLCLLVVARNASFRRLLTLRALAGLSLGALTLVRTNLVPAMILGTLFPTGPSAPGTRRVRATAGILATLVAWLCLMVPWQVFNYRLRAEANSRHTSQQSDTVNSLRMRDLLPITRMDRYAQLDAWNLLRRDPRAYAGRAVRAAVALLLPLPPRGDVAPGICKCQNLRPESPLLGFAERGPPTGLGWRRTFHRIVCSVYKPLVAVAWIGLIAWGATMLAHLRLQEALLAAVPLACVALVCLVLKDNTRYAFPCEALALGFGLPAAKSLLSGVARAVFRD